LQSQSQREVRSGLNNLLHTVKGTLVRHLICTESPKQRRQTQEANFSQKYLLYFLFPVPVFIFISEKRHEFVGGTGEQVTDLLQATEAFNADINKPQEEVIVSELLVIAAHAGHEVLKKLAQGGKSYTPADYIRNLKAHYVDDTDAQIIGAEDPYAFNWAALGNSIAGWLRPAPRSFHMLGPMDAVAKAKRVVAQRRKKDVIAEAVRPDDVEVGGGDEQETDKNMNNVYTIVKENEGCLMTELVLNHNSFAQTVENLFAFSFLIRDRRVKVSDSPEGVRVYKAAPPVKKKKKDRTGDNAVGAGGGADDDDAERFQFVITFNEEIWKEWKQVVNEEDTLMPHRDHHQQQDEQQQQRRQQQNGKRVSEGDGAGASLAGAKRARASSKAD
jgi:non-structural maintenance of chromosomes element 4